MPTALCWDDRFAIHDMGRGGLYLPVEGLVEDDLHVDSTARITRTRNLIRQAGLEAVLRLAEPRPATVDELARVHSREHIERMRRVSEAGGGDAGGGYTPMDGRSYELALLSAGSALTALELVMGSEVENAHAMLRRSGHHAWRDSGYGFCIFNNCAVAARAAQAEHGLGRVAIVDVDAHHGNGSEWIFAADPSVLTVSIHQDRSFPSDSGFVEHVGEGEGPRLERQRQPPGRNRRSRLPVRPGHDRPAGAAAFRAGTGRRGVRSGREPLRSALSPRRDGRRLRRDRRQAAGRRGRTVRRPPGVGAGGRLQPRLRPVLLAGDARDARCGRRSVTRIPTSSSSPTSPAVASSRRGSASRSTGSAASWLPPARSELAALRRARASRARSSGCAARWPRPPPRRLPARRAARIASCSAIERSSRPGRAERGVPDQQEHAPQVDQQLHHPAVAARAGEDVRERGEAVEQLLLRPRGER